MEQEPYESRALSVCGQKGKATYASIRKPAIPSFETIWIFCNRAERCSRYACLGRACALRKMV
jgi:hypothetical protein